MKYSQMLHKDHFKILFYLGLQFVLLLLKNVYTFVFTYSIKFNLLWLKIPFCMGEMENNGNWVKFDLSYTVVLTSKLISLQHDIAQTGPLTSRTTFLFASQIWKTGLQQSDFCKIWPMVVPDAVTSISLWRSNMK